MIESLQDLVQKLKPYLRAEFLDVDTILRGGGGYRIGWTTRDSLPPYSAALTPYVGVITRNVTIQLFSVGVFVSGTNNGSNYWRVGLSVGSTANNIALVNTSAISGSVNAILTSATPVGLSYTTSDAMFYITADKIGAPGNMSYIVPELYVI